ncbi:hypothetical protein NZNM25_07350 [Nitrosopumilus zosterae]|uniref:Uncharacterized protein n=1 Tax=Nitrosopumilus zosterae TaxID=718286 RepID=A0A2S2KQQ3_9ARCH|nr:hypothetical protein NZNM25_07350 [Nitrosopumilus zosterae]
MQKFFVSNNFDVNYSDLLVSYKIDVTRLSSSRVKNAIESQTGTIFQNNLTPFRIILSRTKKSIL